MLGMPYIQHQIWAEQRTRSRNAQATSLNVQSPLWGCKNVVEICMVTWCLWYSHSLGLSVSKWIYSVSPIYVIKTTATVSCSRNCKYTARFSFSTPASRMKSAFFPSVWYLWRNLTHKSCLHFAPRICPHCCISRLNFAINPSDSYQSWSRVSSKLWGMSLVFHSSF